MQQISMRDKMVSMEGEIKALKDLITGLLEKGLETNETNEQ